MSDQQSVLCGIQYSVIFLVFQQYIVYKIIVSECQAVHRVVTCDREGLQSKEGWYNVSATKMYLNESGGVDCTIDLSLKWTILIDTWFDFITLQNTSPS